MINKFVNYVIDTANINSENVKILDYDLDRVYLAIDSEENNYNIRMWNITNDYIQFTLYKLVDDHGEDVANGVFEIEHVYYYFYWHLNNDFPADKVVKAVESHDYETFKKLQRKWGEFYMPNHFLIGDEYVEINENTFAAIDRAEYECG